MDQEVNYKEIITIEAGKRGGKPCIRNMRITVYDVLNWFASGMTREQILADLKSRIENKRKFACAGSEQILIDLQ